MSSEVAKVTRRRLGKTIKSREVVEIEIVGIHFQQQTLACLWDPETGRQWCEHTFTDVEILVVWLEDKKTIDQLYCPKCEQCYRDKYEMIMLEHISDTIDVILLAHQGAPTSIQTNRVQRLFNNVHRWVAKMNLLDNAYREFNELMSRHILLIADFARTTFKRDIGGISEIEQQLRENGKDIALFWSREKKIDITPFWNEHLACTVSYIRSLMLYGKDSLEFQNSIQTCKEKGKRFGRFLDQ